MKKILSLILALLLLAGLFAGCSKTGTAAPTSAEPAAANSGPEATEPAPEPTEPAPEPTEPAPEPTEPAPETTEPAPVETAPEHTEPAGTEPESPEQPATELPVTEPIETEPPVTEPPVTEPVTPEPEPVNELPDSHAPMLFRVTGTDGQEMYLFGTIHVGDERTSQVLEQLTPVLDGCGALAVEFDIVAYENDAQATELTWQQFLYTDGSTVEDHMPAELYDRASALLEQLGLPASLLKYYNLAMWSQLVEEAALMTTSTLETGAGMDRQLIDHCYDRGIEVRDVESAELQYGLMAGFSDELSLLMIREVLDSLDKYGEETAKLYSAWLRGNYDDILALVQEEDEDAERTPEEEALVEDYNYKMLDERNLGMRDKAVEWLEAGDRVFFAVGTAHLVGDAGLVTLLRQAGYTVERVDYAAAPIDDSLAASKPLEPEPTEPDVTGGDPGLPEELIGTYLLLRLNGQTLEEMLLQQAADRGMSEEEFLEAMEQSGLSMEAMVDLVRNQITLTLNADGSWDLDSAGTVISGDWSLEDGALHLQLYGQELGAVLEDGVISIDFAGTEMVFSR